MTRGDTTMTAGDGGGAEVTEAAECVRRLRDAYGDMRAAVLVAWLLRWGRGGPPFGPADDSAVRDWRAFQVRSAGRAWTEALEPVADGLPLTALALERFLAAVFTLLETHRS